MKRVGEPDETPQGAKMKLELHRCKVCGTRWLLWPDEIHGGGWNLLDKYSKPGACCDNVAMGDQIEHLRDIPLTAPSGVREGESTPFAQLKGALRGEESDEQFDQAVAVVREGVGATEAERTLRSIAAMLGWMTVPPQRIFEMEIGALKARALAAVRDGIVSTPKKDEEETDHTRPR